MYTDKNTLAMLDMWFDVKGKLCNRDQEKII